MNLEKIKHWTYVDVTLWLMRLANAPCGSGVLGFRAAPGFSRAESGSSPSQQVCFIPHAACWQPTIACVTLPANCDHWRAAVAHAARNRASGAAARQHAPLSPCHSSHAAMQRPSISMCRIPMPPKTAGGIATW